MTWIEAARGPFERLLEAEEEAGRESVRARLEGLRLAYLDLRERGEDGPLAEEVGAGRAKGPWVLWMLRKALSPPSFEPVRAAWRHGEALETTALQALVEKLSGSGFGPFFDFWIYGDRLPDYRLLKASARTEKDGFVVTLLVENRGTGGYPVPVVVETEEGARHSFSATAGPGNKVELRFPLVTRPTRAAVDPEGDLLMARGERAWMGIAVRKFWIF